MRINSTAQSIWRSSKPQNFTMVPLRGRQELEFFYQMTLYLKLIVARLLLFLAIFSEFSKFRLCQRHSLLFFNNLLTLRCFHKYPSGNISNVTPMNSCKACIAFLNQTVQANLEMSTTNNKANAHDIFDHKHNFPSCRQVTNSATKTPRSSSRYLVPLKAL